MDIDIKELFDDELMMLNLMVNKFEIPADIFLECGASYLMIAVGNSHTRDGMPRDEVPIELMTKARANFERLCQSAPHVPRNAMESLSMAYGAFVLLTNNGTDVCREDGGTPQSHIQALFAITEMRGMAMGNAGLRAGEMHAINNELLRKKNLSEAGAKGAQAKNQLKKRLKTWALEEAKTMRGSDMEISRQLATQVPEHLIKESKNHQRLIYDTLRAQHKHGKPASRNG